MGVYLLIDEIIDYGFDIGLFNDLETKESLKEIFMARLDESDFVESLINTIILKSKQNANVDKNRTKEILFELDRIRLELEYK